jgi:competence protein ComEC
MAERGRARARAGTWSVGAGTRRREPWNISGFAAELFDRAYHWVLAEVGPGRLVPWLPVAFGAGIVVYFTAPREPLLWAPILLFGALAGATIALRAKSVGLPVVLGFAAAAAGFATATVRTDWIGHPVLRHFIPNAAITGWVETRESRERTDRIVIRVDGIEGRRLTEAPGRVRLSVRKGTAPTVGQFVELKARLNPPLAPLKPGSYDFSRDLYFQGIGAIGFVSGEIKATEPKTRPAFWVRYAAFIQGMRDGIDQHIRAALPGDKAAIGSALLTGTRDAISGPVNDAMYISSLAHVLSISGYHVMFAIRSAREASLVLFFL